MPPQVVDHAVRDALLSAGLQGQRHLGPDVADGAHDQRIDIGIDRIDKGRNEQTRALRAHLVHVVEDLREPLTVQDIGDEPSLALGDHEPVAVVVVADIRMVEPRNRPAFPRGAEPPPVPLRDDLLAVGIRRRNQQHHRLLERPLKSVVRRESPRQRHRHLRGGNLAAVDVALDEDHARLRLEQAVFLVRHERSRVRQPRLRRADLGQPGDVPRRRDDGHDHGLPVRRRAQRVERDTLGRGREAGEVAGDLAPVGELPVGSHLEPEHVARAGRGLRDTTGGHDDTGEESERDRRERAEGKDPHPIANRRHER